MFHVIQWQQIMESKSRVSVSFTAFLTPLIFQHDPYWQDPKGNFGIPDLF